MLDEQIKVECLNLALQVAKAGNNLADENKVVDIAEKFYIYVKGTVEAVPESVPEPAPVKKAGRPKKADKVPDPFA